MAAIIIWCKKCWHGYEAHGVIPPVCPACRSDTSWTTYAPAAPKDAYVLTRDDVRFLRSIRVRSAEDASESVE